MKNKLEIFKEAYDLTLKETAPKFQRVLQPISDRDDAAIGVFLQRIGATDSVKCLDRQAVWDSKIFGNFRVTDDHGCFGFSFRNPEDPESYFDVVNTINGFVVFIDDRIPNRAAFGPTKNIYEVIDYIESKYAEVLQPV